MVQRSADETRGLLLEAGIAALRDLTAGGLITAVGTRAIAQRAGVSAATLFHHFGSVEGYAAALLERVYDPGTSPVEEINAKVEELGVADLPLSASLAFHESEFERVEDDREHRLRVGLWAFGGREASAAYGHYVRTSDARIIAVTARLYAAWGREVRPPFDLPMFVAAQAALLSGSVIRHVADPAATDAARFAQTAAALSLVMLREPGDRLGLDDRLTEINQYGQTGPAQRGPSSPATTRARIVRAAEELFASVGHDETTVAAVARAARVSASSVYALVDSRAGLAVAVLLDQAAALDPGPGLDGDGERPRDALLRRLRVVAGFLAPRRELTAAYLAMLVTGANLPGPDPLRAAVVHALEAARGSGAVRPDVDVETVAPSLLVALATPLVTQPAGGVDGALAQVTALCLDGLA